MPVLMLLLTACDVCPRTWTHAETCTAIGVAPPLLVAGRAADAAGMQRSPRCSVFLSKLFRLQHLVVFALLCAQPQFESHWCGAGRSLRHARLLPSLAISALTGLVHRLLQAHELKKQELNGNSIENGKTKEEVSSGVPPSSDDTAHGGNAHKV